MIEQTIYSQRYKVKAITGGWVVDLEHTTYPLLCDCGQKAVATVGFNQLTALEMQPVRGTLPLCARCLAEFRAVEPGASVTYFQPEEG